MCFKAQFEGLVSVFMIWRKKIALVSNIPLCLVCNFKTFTVRKPIFKKKETKKEQDSGVPKLLFLMLGPLAIPAPRQEVCLPITEDRYVSMETT